MFVQIVNILFAEHYHYHHPMLLFDFTISFSLFILFSDAITLLYSNVHVSVLLLSASVDPSRCCIKYLCSFSFLSQMANHSCHLYTFCLSRQILNNNRQTILYSKFNGIAGDWIKKVMGHSLIWTCGDV